MSNFKLIASKSIDSIGVVYEEYEHRQWGTKHIHLASANSENSFLVGFPTLPNSDDGRAHILEHLALCGSENFPVRDPFFAMTRRSLATFMNAMTYADRTVYPFASQDRKDYFNLLSVYLDAAFNPKLEYLDFRQEGWRHEMDENGKLSYQGVVFNEMKGAMANPVRAAWKGIEEALKQGTTYAFESGGDPVSIPDLTHAELLQFHSDFYHPTRAVFMTYGDIPAAEIQAKLDELIFNSVTERKEPAFPQLAKATGSIERTIQVPVQGDDSEMHALQATWLLAPSTDIEELVKAEVLSAILMSDSASPIMHALESAGFGQPGSILGVSHSEMQMTFHLGMEGLREDELEKARSVIFDALQDVAERGIPAERLDGILRDFELGQKEVTGGRTPYGLQLLLKTLPAVMNGGDALAALDMDPVLDDIRRHFSTEGYVQALVKELLLDNPNRVIAHIAPDPQYFEKMDAKIAERLAKEEAALTPEAIEVIRQESDALRASQRETPDFSVLPQILPSELNPSPKPTLPGAWTTGDSGPSTWTASIPSNGVSYLSANFDASGFAPEDWQWIRLYTRLADSVGSTQRSWKDAEIWRRERCSDFSCSLSHYLDMQSQRMLLRVTYSCKGLDREQDGMAEVLDAAIRSTEFSDHERLRYLIKEAANDERQSLSESASTFASLHAQRDCSNAAKFNELVDGISYTRFIIALSDNLSEGAGPIADKLRSIHEQVVNSACALTAAASGGAEIALARAAESRLVGLAPMPAPGYAATTIPLVQQDPDTESLYFASESQVQHVCLSWKAPDATHPDAPALTVLGHFLRNGFLHRAIREEGGAYGAGASYSSGSLAFNMTSFRDPRFDGTLKDFSAAKEWLANEQHSQEALNQAIISAIQSMDKPMSPRGEAGTAWARLQSASSEDLRAAYRKGVLECTVDDLRRVASVWLSSQPHIGVYGSKANAQAATEFGLTVTDLIQPEQRRKPASGPKK